MYIYDIAALRRAYVTTRISRIRIRYADICDARNESVNIYLVYTNLSILIYIYTYIGKMHIYLSRFENDGSSATATRERRNERIINIYIYIYIRVGIWNGIPRSNIRYNVCTEKSEFPSDPFRYNRDVSNYSFDILPINVRDVDGWDWKKCLRPLSHERSPSLAPASLPLSHKFGGSIVLIQPCSVRRRRSLTIDRWKIIYIYMYIMTKKISLSRESASETRERMTTMTISTCVCTYI